MKKHLLLVGAGHAHVATFRNLHRLTACGHRVTVVSPSPFYHYSGMGPGVLSGIYPPAEGRIAVRRLVERRGARFVEDKVVAIEVRQRRVVLAGGAKLPFDVISFNIGSSIPLEGFRRFGGPAIPAKPIENFLQARRSLLGLLARGRRLDLVVVGGGPAAVEIAGSLWRLVRDAGASAAVTVIAGGRLLGRFPPALRRLAASSLETRGVRILEQRRVVALEADAPGHGPEALAAGVGPAGCGPGRVILDDGECVPMDFALVATGVQLSPLFRDSGLPVGDDLGLRVDRHLQCPACSGMFGGGDCVSFEPEPLDKVGVVANRQNPVLYHNLRVALSGAGRLQAFESDPAYSLMFNLGDGSALWWRGRLAWKGRFPFLLKNAIDRRFMRRYRNAETHL